MKKSYLILSVLVFLAVAVLIYSHRVVSVDAQQPEMSQLLITEVRELRRTLQEFATTGQRMQIALERIRLQQDNVDRLQGELVSITSQAEVNVSEMQQLEESAKTMERLLGIENDAVKRIGIENERKTSLLRLEEGKKREIRLREKEVQLNAMFNIEKAALAELKSKVEEIDHQLENQAPPRRK